jgi:hypothetical protein
MTPQRRKLTSALLLISTVGDLGLATVAVLWPDLWFRLIHGAPRVDPEHMLTRTGVLWLTFALFHLVAWLLWQSRPYWLAIVAGMPLSEIFADVAWMLAADHMTTLGRIVLTLAAPANLFLAIFFVRSYLLAAREADEARAAAAAAPGP